MVGAQVEGDRGRARQGKRRRSGKYSSMTKRPAGSEMTRYVPERLPHSDCLEEQVADAVEHDVDEGELAGDDGR